MASKPGDRLLAEALSWEGVPWVKSGQDRRGVDCLNWVGAVAKLCGFVIGLPFRDYSYGFWKRSKTDLMLESVRDASENWMADGYRLVATPTIAPGDLVLVTQLRKLDVCTHAVIAVAQHTWGLEIIHASQSLGRVARRCPLTGRVLYAFRVEEVIHG